MASPLVLVVVIFLTVAGIFGMVIYLLLPAREKILNNDPAENDSRISSQWAGGDDTPTHHLQSHANVIHHDFGSSHGGFDGGGGPLH